MHVIGITGGVGCGKSTVSKYLQEKHSASIIIADDIGRDLMKRGSECYDRLAEAVGSSYIESDGTIDSKLLGKVAFSDTSLLTKLNAIIHPAVAMRIAALLDGYNKKECQMVAIESAILFESGLDKKCDETWYVYAGIKTRWKRVRFRPGYDRKRFDDVLIHQMNESDFRKACDYTIENDSDEMALKRQVDERVKKIVCRN